MILNWNENEIRCRQRGRETQRRGAHSTPGSRAAVPEGLRADFGAGEASGPYVVEGRRWRRRPRRLPASGGGRAPPPPPEPGAWERRRGGAPALPGIRSARPGHRRWRPLGRETLREPRESLSQSGPLSLSDWSRIQGGFSSAVGCHSWW